MIPKIIHYCWFGRGEKPELAVKCIESWKKYCPDYQIIEWNEDNIDLSKTPLYTQQAYEAKKWAFATDYVRLWAVYNYGGIYLDTDVEMLKPIDDLLELTGFIGFETHKNVNTGLGFGAEKENSIIKTLMDSYNLKSFAKKDGSLDLTPGPILNTDVLVSQGLKLNNKMQTTGNVTILPCDYLCPQNIYTGKTKITKNTYTIHHYAASWVDNKKLYNNMFSAWLHTSETADYLIHIPNRVLRKVLGDKAYENLKRKIKG